MDNKDVKDMAVVFTESLADTQDNAINTEKLVQQVCRMSGEDLRRQIITEIMADEDTPLGEKIDLFEKVSTGYDQRLESNTRRLLDMQNTQTQNIQVSSDGVTENLVLIAVAALCVLGIGALFTPIGKNVIVAGSKLLRAA